MPRMHQGKDAYSAQILRELREKYLPAHDRAQIKVYRYNSTSIRIRILDPDFAGKSIVEREEMVWPILDALPDEIVQDISILLLLTPEERNSSFLSQEFDTPSRSTL